jgi:gamma-glutamyltranspeptidase/glutathione hydrolase
MDFETTYPSVRQPLMARNIVATSQPLAAQAGLRMLLNGGNAVDAALAAAIALTVVEPTSNGIGSDAFAILWDGSNLHGLNASGRSPAGWMPERFAHLDQMPQRGWDTVTVPGAVSAWRSLSSKFGRLPFADLFEPAIAYARDGYVVSPVIARSWQRAAEVLHSQPGFAEAFMPAPRPGETFRLPAMAKTLGQIAESGGEDFYRGDLARQIIDFSDACGGVMTLDDLASHTADWCGTVSLKWHGYEMHEIPPNGQGIAALIALGILQEVGGLGDLSPDSPESIHLQLEAMKLAFADLHQYVSDPAFMDVPPSALLDPAYLRSRAALVDRARAQHPEYGLPPRSGTVYLTAADKDGMMVSFIQSNFMGFGSGVVVPGTGISLQNRGCGFRSKPGHANSVGPRKRPFHTIIPGFVTRDGQPVMSFGVMGGAMQAQGHVQMAIRVLLHGQNPQAASDAPRWQVLEGGVIGVEAAMPASVIESLRAHRHAISVESGWHNQSFGGAQLIKRLGDGYVAGSDQRKDGGAVGF